MIEQPSPSPPAAAPIQPWPRFFVIWFCIAALLIGSHLGFYLKQSYYEGGDFAANALQIRKAKIFHELYGNYSRWGFHHPGPAFFYAYAAGEVLLFDTLRVVPTPFNAHLLVGVLLQSLFFAWTVTMVFKHVRRPLLVPLLLVFAGLHFGLVNFSVPDSAFESLWSPYVLLCPFLCFLVAGASVASGDASDLVPMVLAGSFLVHGHVAQPLFVVPLALLAYAVLSMRHGRSISRLLRASPYAHAIAAGVVLLFVLPIALDAFRGQQSNLRLILAHFSKHSDDHKTLLQSLAFFVAFVCYLPNPEIICDRLTHASVVQFGLRWPLLLLWSLIAIALSALPRLSTDKRDSPSRLFARWLATFFGIACLLTLVWGMLINGEMFAFNSYFNYGLLFVPFILLAIALASLPRLQRATYLRLIVLGLSVPLGVLAARNFALASDFPTISRDTKPWFDQVRRAAQADKQGVPLKFLSFEHSDWPWAAGVALALQRIGCDYAVPQDWLFMFDFQHVANLPEVLSQQKAALWKVRSPATAGEGWVSYNPPSVNPLDSEISFSGPEPNAKAFVVFGWEVSTGPFSWSIGNSGLLYFLVLPTPADVEVELEVFSEEFAANKTQRMSVSFNDAPLQSFQVGQRSVLKLRIPAEKWNRRPAASMSFQFPDAIAPSAAGVSGDPRILGCGFVRISFHLAPRSE
jgi:hypothetical protein